MIVKNMVDRDYGTIGAAISSIIGLVALVYGYPEFKALGGVIVGATITYVVQTRLQNQAEKNKIRKKNMEETLIPVLLMLRDIKRKLESANLFQCTNNWDQYKRDYRRFIFTGQFYDELNGFYESYNQYITNLASLRQIFIPMINQFFEKFFFSNIEAQSNLMQSEHLPNFKLFWNDYYYDQVPWVDPIMLGYDPFDVYKIKFKNFNIRNVEIIADVFEYDDNRNPSGKKEYKINMKEHLDQFNEFLSAVMKEMEVKKDVIDLRELNRTLISKIEKIISKLEKYVDKYYPVEPI